MTRKPLTRRALDVLVIGAGQAGMAIGRELSMAGLDFLMLDAAPTLGHVWRSRWDSLRLFTPARYSGLPGLPFPGAPDAYPTKDEVAEYLAAYAQAFALPIALDEGVESLERDPHEGFIATTPYARYRARQVVIATGPSHAPNIPAFAATLPHHVVQLHSSEYRSPSQLPRGPVLVVGAGNSGVQIATELGPSRPTSLAVGRKLRAAPTRVLGRSLFEWLDRLGAMRVSVQSPLGRRMRTHEVLIGAKPWRALRRAGVEVVARAVAGDALGVRLNDQRVMATNSVIWATGFKPRYPWLHAPVLDAAGRPAHTRGVTAVPGLYFLGLPWLNTRGSSLLGWVGNDAAWLAQQIVARRHSR